MLDRLKLWVRSVKRDAVALYLAARDPRTPWYAKALAAVVVAYALSPIDLIPDFIPVLGYLDDIVIVPLGLWLVLRMIPAEVMEECRVEAEALAERPTSVTAAVVVVLIWIGLTLLAAWAMYGALMPTQPG
ncbi:YkvA family protein [Thalassobaculum sp.]|uniref:YkvA family protein n=1 Tax=Thalassobaculum sp. TaxID=2022740 RepID=UPI003B5B5F02